MSLRAKISEEDSVTVITLEGKLNFENQTELQDNVNNFLKNGKQLVFDLGGLSFVGSSGITKFIRSLKNSHIQGAPTPRFCNVSKEFQRLFQTFDASNELSIHENKSDAMHGFFRAGTKENN